MCPHFTGRGSEARSKAPGSDCQHHPGGQKPSRHPAPAACKGKLYSLSIRLGSPAALTLSWCLPGLAHAPFLPNSDNLVDSLCPSNHKRTQPGQLGASQSSFPTILAARSSKPFPWRLGGGPVCCRGPRWAPEFRHLRLAFSCSVLLSRGHEWLSRPLVIWIPFQSPILTLSRLQSPRCCVRFHVEPQGWGPG